MHPLNLTQTFSTVIWNIWTELKEKLNCSWKLSILCLCSFTEFVQNLYDSQNYTLRSKITEKLERCRSKTEKKLRFFIPQICTITSWFSYIFHLKAHLSTRIKFITNYGRLMKCRSHPNRKQDLNHCGLCFYFKVSLQPIH